jgi:hypothetical protein
VNTRIKILQWILTKLGTYLGLRRVWNPIDLQGQWSMSQGQFFTVLHPCEHSRINILQWILTKLGTTLRRPKYVPSLVKIHWRILILVFTRMLCGKNLTLWPLTLKSIGFQTLPRTMYVPSLVKIHWRMLILECSPEKFIVNRGEGEAEVDNEISRGNNLIYHPLSYVLLSPRQQSCEGI